jgi:hypothetical protein
MIMAYINYPNPHITIHGNSNCSHIQVQRKRGQRVIRLNSVTISSQLKRLAAKYYIFGAQARTNDMWLDIDFGDPEFEAAVTKYIKRIVGRHYKPLESAKIARHC